MGKTKTIKGENRTKHTFNFYLLSTEYTIAAAAATTTKHVLHHTNYKNNNEIVVVCRL